jgi:hypothetical protein
MLKNEQIPNGPKHEPTKPKQSVNHGPRTTRAGIKKRAVNPIQIATPDQKKRRVAHSRTFGGNSQSSNSSIASFSPSPGAAISSFYFLRSFFSARVLFLPRFTLLYSLRRPL